MDNGLVQLLVLLSKDLKMVLILVVVDNGLVHTVIKAVHARSVRLNPCCNGQWSRTILTTNIQIFQEVLILVVMEDGLVQYEVDGQQVIAVYES